MLLRIFLVIFLFCVSSLSWSVVYPRPADDESLIGSETYVQAEYENTFTQLARHYDVGYNQLKRANPGVDPWLPKPGTTLTIPTQHILPDAKREGIVINIAEMRLYYFPPEDSEDADKVYTFPLGIGREGWDTPLGKTTVTHKKANPTWTPPESIRKEHAEKGDPLPKVVAAGPDNPLGQHAIYLGFPSYLLHGTNKPDGIGLRVSHGCLRLFPDDIGALFAMVKPGTPVNIIDQPYKFGWSSDKLYMEAHPPDAVGSDHVQSYTPWVKRLIQKTQDKPDLAVDWDMAQQTAEQARGVPTVIKTKTEEDE